MGLLLSWRRWFAATAGKLQGPVCLASTNSCLTYELGANQRNMHLRSPFQKLSISLKSWHLLKWASQKWVSPIVSHCTMEPHRNQKPLKQILFHFFHCFVLSPYFRYFFLLGEKEVWRVSTSTGPRRTRRLSSGVDAATSSYSVREHELPGKSGAIVSTSTNISSWQGLHGDNSQVSQLEQYNSVLPFLNIWCLGQAS